MTDSRRGARSFFRGLGRLRCNRSGIALLEFALCLPILLLTGGYGIELSNVALVRLKISQIALNLADNSSRVGLFSSLATTQLREVDMNDVFQAARLQGAGIKLTTYGRITISSLENVQQSYDTTNVQRIHWQRCAGKAAGTGYDSSYGTTSTTAGQAATSGYAGTAMANGMGDAGYLVTAPQGSGLMFVEINYKYQPLFGSLFVKAPIIHYTASYIVRDNRDYGMIYNPSPAATRSTCNLYTT